SVEYDGIANSVAPSFLRENVAHTSKIALALFAYIPDENDVRDALYSRMTQGAGQRKERRNTGRIVADAWTVELLSIFRRLHVSALWKNRVEMSRDRNRTRRDVSAHTTRTTRPCPSHVPDFVDLEILQLQLRKTLPQPFRPLALSEGGRRNCSQFQLQFAQFALVEAKPIERQGHTLSASRLCDLLLDGKLGRLRLRAECHQG